MDTLVHDALVEQKQKMTYRSAVSKITFLGPSIALVQREVADPSAAEHGDHDVRGSGVREPVG